MHVEASIVTGYDDRLAGMDSHSCPRHHAFGPGMAGKCPLPSHGRRHRISGLGEGNEEGIPLDAHLVRFERRKCGPKKPAMLTQDLDVPVAKPLQELCRTFDVGE